MPITLKFCFAIYTEYETSLNFCDKNKWYLCICFRAWLSSEPPLLHAVHAPEFLEPPVQKNQTPENSHQ